MNKIRLDLLLLERGLASTRTKAQDLILSGAVIVSGKLIKKPGEKFFANSHVELLQAEHPFVSRGGVKLDAALQGFGISVLDKVVLDVGISTGGFADCVLKRGAKRVFGVDVGSNQLADELRADQRLVFFESTHIKDLSEQQITLPIDLLVADLSFISLKKVIPFFLRFLHASSDLVLLVKPQFELDQNSLGSGGIVKKAEDREFAIEGVQQSLQENGYRVKGRMLSPITGGDGNIESFLHAVLRSPNS